MKERFICCCRSGWGTVIIAISEIIIFLYLVTVTSRQLNELSSPVLPNDTSIVIEPAIKLVVSSIGLIFALLLLDGVLRHIPGLMQAWIVWAVVVLFFIVFKLNLLMFHNQEMDFLESFLYIFLLAFQLAGLFIVLVYLMDIAPDQFQDKYTTTGGFIETSQLTH
ncbi:unnamed protein product [Allacma fusca]|uniref:Uncharacterized protein n=1 Tax=Allacma fusca TaxID=39272 RepID=A0A8J2K2T4_9HEXA|nr:unnamed protein product [Allacma fusca]